MLEVGTAAQVEAVKLFQEWHPDDPTHTFTAEGFKVRIRVAGEVDVEQTRRRTTGLHPEYGGLMMTKGLIPARDATHDEATDILERHVFEPLKVAGF